MSYLLVTDDQYVELYKNEELVLYCGKDERMKDLSDSLADLLKQNGLDFISVDSDEYYRG